MQSGKRSTNDIIFEDGSEYLYVKDVIIGFFGCPLQGNNGKKEFNFYVTNVLSGENKNDVIGYGAKSITNAVAGDQFITSSKYGFAFDWMPHTSGDIRLSLNEYHGSSEYNDNKSIVVVESFFSPEIPAYYV